MLYLMHKWCHYGSQIFLYSQFQQGSGRTAVLALVSVLHEQIIPTLKWHL